MDKPTIKILPIDQAPWITLDMIKPGMNWAYRIISPDNEAIGVMGGTKKEVTQRVKELGKKIMRDGKGLHPFARPIKFNKTGVL